MKNLVSLWANLDLRRRIVVIGATLAMFAAVLGLSRLASSHEMALLYAGLETAAAGEVIAALDQRGIAYQVRSDSILVDATARDSIRMALATEGLPSAGPSGYELLDGLSGFGTTSQMFDAAYWRAKEGELARTILASSGIKSARVHIAHAPAEPFRQNTRAKASVTVTSGPAGLSKPQVKALQHLVAAAVTGLQPADVSIIDSVKGLISAPDDGDLSGSAAADRAADLRRNVERLLEARVGAGHAVVEVSVDLETDREQITERTFDPQGRVAISTETQQKSGSSRDGEADVTVASNLPEGDAAAGNNRQSQNNETHERVNFEVSETQREVVREPGRIRRLGVAVLVDGIQKTAADGTVAWEARPAEELAVLRELVRSAVGFDEARGDVLTLESLAFEPVATNGTLAEAGMLWGIGQINLMSVLQTAVFALVTLVLGLFVLRPILTGSSQTQAIGKAQDLPALPPAMAAATNASGIRVVSGEIQDIGDLPDMQVVMGEGLAIPDDPMARLRRLIEERQAESVEILRGWLESEEEPA